MGNKVQFELDGLMPKTDAGYSGNPFDPARVHINKALGSYGAIPPYFIPAKEEVITRVNDPSEILQGYRAVGIIHSVMPMHVKRIDDTEWFTLPIEPLVSVCGKNTIIRRKVAKSIAKGTVKERWSQDDYEITIQGVLSESDESAYPQGYLRQLIALFDERRAIEVKQDVLLVFGITHLAIENASFPHTKSLNNQNFEIKAFSDNQAELLISL